MDRPGLVAYRTLCGQIGIVDVSVQRSDHSEKRYEILARSLYLATRGHCRQYERVHTGPRDRVRYCWRDSLSNHWTNVSNNTFASKIDAGINFLELDSFFHLRESNENTVRPSVGFSILARYGNASSFFHNLI